MARSVPYYAQVHILGFSVALFSVEWRWKNGTGLRRWPVVVSFVRGAQRRQSNIGGSNPSSGKKKNPKFYFFFLILLLRFFPLPVSLLQKEVFCKINYFKFLEIILLISMSDLSFLRPGAVEEWFGY